ncbi:hypothetical protein CF67_09026 [Candidatus Photodesmus blepharus]|uniref:Pyridoxal phosphate homeostasis protein n=1 Tax=Candidatus Photodesmus blepharonis TaxID=1179155 RepID=A0A084CM27_9GAMM|nr:YggS family pyridoxal phosphate-dependent enzyme [Candidatus Photodesmus blepharus]KEY90856.1 hypothetical protein CF67_09026 [Candidatus Photodesmus blepharus]
MNNIQKNIKRIISQIESAQKKYGRARNSVQLLAVSKTKPIEAILDAVQGGQKFFGENYVQESINKIQFFRKNYANLSLKWHFIGPIQSNKTRHVSENFDWVHTINRAKIAQRLNDQRPVGMEPIQVLIQVNTCSEKNKFGVFENEIFALVDLITSLPNLTLRGLMSIPANTSDHQSQFIAFSKLTKLKNKLTKKYPQLELDTLSMGMSGDMDAAIRAGSTMLRIGTSIFGTRNDK